MQKKVIKLKFIDHSSKNDIRKFNQLRRSERDIEQKEVKPSAKPVIKKKKKEAALSRRDIEDLMGARRDTYKCVGGAIRRK
ncbi:hypothetical protein F7731_08590 [Cytobacillus depressus]|uniref:Uncharacterized protein n=1 Tax=Cytobacillus depressus TaxID=1602942 RepID=A0A6L3V876_9BACI|nr:hypothetical protein [Cytobacillus depressus]KAB2337642.1 hypothetical protein F7731_08590 [Cytobacillus depressus]